MRFLAIFGAALITGGCATVDYSKAVPALLTEKSVDARPEISRVLSEALEGRKVTLSADILTTDSRLIIEPKPEGMDPFGNPASGRLMGRPDHFILKTVDNQCALFHEKSGKYYPLYGVTCKPV